MKCCALHTEIPRRQEPYIKPEPWMPSSLSDLAVENMLTTPVSAHVSDCLIASKSKDIVVAFKKELLTRCVGTDEGEVTEYLG
jgi:hypothetical protein